MGRKGRGRRVVKPGGSERGSTASGPPLTIGASMPLFRSSRRRGCGLDLLKVGTAARPRESSDE
eukprot:7423257-Pyramimonas_sp.AAC.1